MRLLCLDLSTNTGWALLLEEALLEYGNIKSKAVGSEESPDYPMNFIAAARKIALSVHELVTRTRPEAVVIEETNKGKNRFSQKQLEFIHYSVNIILDSHPLKPKVCYIDTSEWRWLLGITLDKDQRKQNRNLNSQRSEIRQQFEKLFDQSNAQMYSLACAHQKKLDRNRAVKEYMKKRDEWVKIQMKPVRIKQEGKVIGKISTKHLSVGFVNERFHTKFKHKDNDIADAICLGVALEKKLKQAASSPVK